MKVTYTSPPKLSFDQLHIGDIFEDTHDTPTIAIKTNKDSYIKRYQHGGDWILVQVKYFTGGRFVRRNGTFHIQPPIYYVRQLDGKSESSYRSSSMTFDQLHIGDVFWFRGDTNVHVCIKTTSDNCITFSPNGLLTVPSSRSRKAEVINPSDNVIKLEAELVIE